MSWASLVKQTAPLPAAGPDAAPSTSARVAIVDANAIISGLQLYNVADRFITTQDVLDEIRDKHSRQLLASLPFSLEIQEPEDSSVQAVTSFARETGDLHALSRTDVRLLALAHGMEVAANGSSHLRQHPVQASVRPKHRSKGRALPGWGSVPNPQDWAAMDALPDSAGQGSSRIRGGVQALDAVEEGTGPETVEETAPAASTAAATTAPEFSAAADSSTLPHGSFGAAATADLATSTASGAPQPPAAAWFAAQSSNQPVASQAVPADPYAGVGHFAGGPLPPPGVSEVGDDDDDDDDGEEEGEWEQAGKSKGAVRRRRRNQARYEARQARREQAGAGTVPATALPQGVAAPQATPVAAAPAATADQGANVTAADATATDETEGLKTDAAGGSGKDADAGEALEQGEEEQSEEETGEGEDEEEGTEEDEGEEEEGEEGEGGEGEEQASTAGGPEGESGSTVGAVTTASGTDCGEFTLNTTSNVACVTADFAMQNVLLQMGLRLVTRDGKQISRLSRWAVRCSACFFVTKEAGKLFCPRCGNMTLDRVEVMVGPEGAEFYGVRKRHVLRGTIFSLPKPKGGRAKNLIMREDELLHKLKPRRKKKSAQQDLDPYAPEHGTQEAWQLNLASGQEVLANTKGAAFLMAGWKHNPNERKPVASNRRRK